MTTPKPPPWDLRVRVPERPRRWEPRCMFCGRVTAFLAEEVGACDQCLVALRKRTGDQ